MANLFYNMMIFAISLELACYGLWAFGLLPAMGITYPFGDATALNNVGSLFSIDLWSGLVAGAGVAISIATLLLRQQTFAIYAMLLFAIGVFFNIVKGIILVIPNTIAALLPGQTNPFAYTNGVYNPNYAGANPIQVIVGMIVVFAGFIFLAELVTQRKLSS